MNERRMNEKLKTATLIITILIFAGGVITASIVYANTQNAFTTGIEKNFSLIEINGKAISDQRVELENVAKKSNSNEKAIAEVKNVQSITNTNQEWIINTLININKKLDNIEESLK